MSRDADAVRDGRPTVLQSLTEDPAATAVLAWVRAQLAAADAL
ncbi:urease accessory ureG domain protein [Mycobacterium kansasii 732]|nr:urease accessory ureG domain protein [Mycobacterium kansasii 732]